MYEFSFVSQRLLASGERTGPQAFCRATESECAIVSRDMVHMEVLGLCFSEARSTEDSSQLWLVWMFALHKTQRCE